MGLDKNAIAELNAYKNDNSAQIDFVKLLQDHNQVSDVIYVKKTGNKLLNVSIPYRGKKAACYTIGLQTDVGSDEYMKMMGLSVAELALSKDMDSKTGTWVTINNQNWYASVIGATQTIEFTGTGINFNFFSDTRGGIWSFVVDSGDPVVVSTYSDPSVMDNYASIASGLTLGSHTVVATFMGDDPAHVPSSGVGTARGWAKHTAVGYETKFTFTTFGNPDGKNPYKVFDVMPALSNTEYAINATIYGTEFASQFFPQHNGIPTVFAVDQNVYFDDDLVTTWTPLDIDGKPFKSVKVVQNMLAKHPDDPTNPIMEIRTIHTFNALGVSVVVKIKFLRKLLLGGSFGMMFPISTSFGKQLITSRGNRYDSVLIDGTTNDLVTEGDSATSFAFINNTGTLGEKDIVMAVTVYDPIRTYRHGKVGQQTPLLTLKHNNTTYQKLYPRIYMDGTIIEVGDIYEGSFTFNMGELPMASDMLP